MLDYDTLLKHDEEMHVGIWRSGSLLRDFKHDACVSYAGRVYKAEELLLG